MECIARLSGSGRGRRGWRREAEARQVAPAERSRRRALARGGGWDGDGVGWWWMLVAWQPRQIDRRCAARPPLAPRPPPSRVSHRSREPRCDRAFIDAPSFLLLASFCSSRDKLLRVLFSADTRSAGFERKGGGGEEIRWMMMDERRKIYGARENNEGARLMNDDRRKSGRNDVGWGWVSSSLSPHRIVPSPLL